MRFKKLGSEDVGEASSRRHMNPITGDEEINITDQDLVATPPLEDEPDFRDILPDQIQSFRAEGDEDDEDGWTARPREEMRLIDREQLPEG